MISVQAITYFYWIQSLSFKKRKHCKVILWTEICPEVSHVFQVVLKECALFFDIKLVMNFCRIPVAKFPESTFRWHGLYLLSGVWWMLHVATVCTLEAERDQGPETITLFSVKCPLSHRDQSRITKQDKFFKLPESKM